ncbi:hypothetical protein M408DRAFT_182338 [Serendipita vermifera MAFF 305830]|uniref:Uncharacterized protein n=1 Tax=Serendipita vermifera MAFF 305830 TaxID=933852 RepID=A0A0C3APZ2_SERVB|nr:hypothetical protein M408DRAFT_182338 [Serendipita vermifera MAFF 305830]
MLTCQRWYSITTTYSALWRSIAFCTIHKPEKGTVHCSDLESLALAVSRTRGATFDLYLGGFSQFSREDVESFNDIVGVEWLSRCR